MNDTCRCTYNIAECIVTIVCCDVYPNRKSFFEHINICSYMLLLLSLSIMSYSLGLHRLLPTRLLCPWDFPGKNTGVVAISFSRGSSQPRDQTHVSCISRHWQADSLPMSHHGSLYTCISSVQFSRSVVSDSL